MVSHLLMNAEGQADGVAFIDRTTRAAREVRGKVVVLAASALESTRILLNSRSRRFPDGVGNSNGVLGHYLMDHTTLEHGGGVMPALKSSKREPVGRPCGYIIPKYINTSAKYQNKNFLRGYYFAGDGRQELYGHAASTPGFGRKWRDKVRDNIPYAFSLYAQGECLPRHDNYVELDPEKKDAWGIPALHIHASYGENELAMAKAMRNHLGEMMDELKLEDRQPPRDELNIFGKNIHECGTARMGHDPKTSVLNAYNQVHDVEECLCDRWRLLRHARMLGADAHHHGDFGSRSGSYRRRVPEGQSMNAARMVSAVGRWCCALRLERLGSGCRRASAGSLWTIARSPEPCARRAQAGGRHRNRAGASPKRTIPALVLPAGRVPRHAAADRSDAGRDRRGAGGAGNCWNGSISRSPSRRTRAKRRSPCRPRIGRSRCTTMARNRSSIWKRRIRRPFAARAWRGWVAKNRSKAFRMIDRSSSRPRTPAHASSLI